MKGVLGVVHPPAHTESQRPESDRLDTSVWQHCSLKSAISAGKSGDFRALWASRCGLPSSVSEHPPQCSNISRLHGTGMTDFANNPMDGDGSLVYPGATGLVSSNRLEQIADGIEV